MKYFSFTSIETLEIQIYDRQSLLDLLDFIKINNGLKILKVNGYLSCNESSECLGEFLQSIGKYCQNLESLEIFYDDMLDQQLIEIFNNCVKLKSICFKIGYYRRWFKFDGNRILNVLNQALPENLNTIIFKMDVHISNKSLKNLMKSWKGPKPFKVELHLNKLRIELKKLLKKYQDLGFLIMDYHFLERHHIYSSMYL